MENKQMAELDAYDWVKIPDDLPKSDLVMITAKTPKPKKAFSFIGTFCPIEM